MCASPCLKERCKDGERCHEVKGRKAKQCFMVEWCKACCKRAKGDLLKHGDNMEMQCVLSLTMYPEIYFSLFNGLSVHFIYYRKTPSLLSQLIVRLQQNADVVEKNIYKVEECFLQVSFELSVDDSCLNN